MMSRVLLIGLLFLALNASAEPYAPGDRIEPFALDDQHGETHQIDAAVAIILFSRDMPGGELLKAALADVQEGALERVNAVYISDISGMPGLIARLFAVPAMRRRPYSMLLDRDGSKTQRLPDVPEKATAIFLERGEITRVLHLETPAEVLDALDLPGSC